MRALTIYFDDEHDSSMAQLQKIMLTDWPIVALSRYHHFWNDSFVPSDHSGAHPDCTKRYMQLRKANKRAGRHRYYPEDD